MGPNNSRATSFKIAFLGLWHALSTQKNFQIQVFITFAVVLAAWIFSFSRIEWLILLLIIVVVLTAELINTVVEVVVDIAVREQLLPEAKIAKDVSAAAVLLTSIGAVIIGVLLFVPHFG